MKNQGMILFLMLLFGNISLLFSQELSINLREFGAKANGVFDDTETIQNAINSLKESKGGVLIFPNGSYLISNTLKTSTPNVRFKFYPGAKIILSNNVKGAFLIMHDNCSVENANIVGNGIVSPSVYEGYGIMVAGSYGAKILNCNLTKISGVAIFLIRSRSKGCTNNLVSGNRITSPANKGQFYSMSSAILLGLSGSGYSHENNVISKNFIDGNFTVNFGINISCHGKNNTIDGNTVKNLLRYGILVYESKHDQNKLTRNFVLNNLVENIGAINGTTNNMGMGIYLMQSHNSVVQGNRVINVLINSDRSETLSRGAIAIGGSTDCQITNNFIDGSGRYGIYSSYGFNNNYINNTINNVKESGIYLMNSNNNRVEGNKFSKISKLFIRGNFGNTGNYTYANTNLLKKYIDIPTGNDISVKGNVFYGSKDNFIFMEGNGRGQRNSVFQNSLENISILNNTFYGVDLSEKKTILIRAANNRTLRVSGNNFKKQ